MHPAVSGHQVGRMFKERTVVCYGLYGLSMLVGVLQDLVACDDATLDFIEHHLAAKLNQCAALVPRDGTGVWLKQAEHFLVRTHLLALKHTGARLDDDALDQW